MAFWQTNTGFQVWINNSPFSTWFSTGFSASKPTNTATKNDTTTYNPRYPGFNEEDYKKLEKMVADKGVTWSKKTEIMDELYQIYYPQVLNQHKLDERQVEINKSVYQNGEALLNGNKEVTMGTKLTTLAQDAKKKFNIPYDTPDDVVLDYMVKWIPNWNQLLYDYANGKNNDIYYEAWIKERQKETWWQKAADFWVGVLQSPWKRGYNMIWQWMDKLWKAVADKLEWTDLQKWVQEKAIEAFWEDEVRAFQEANRKAEEEWTLFNGREATDIRTPLLWEERANNGWTKAWEIVWDIGTAAALSAPMASALAPAMAGGTIWDAALIWAFEWGADTLLSQYGTQWNLDVSPAQAVLGFVGGALWWMLTNKLANMPKNQADNIRKEASKYIEKSIKPTVKGKQSQAAYDQFIDDTLDITDYMSKNKKILEYTDDAGETIRWELPKNLRETSEALWNMKKYIYDQYNSLAQKAGDAWAKVNLNKVYDKLDDLANNNAVNLANPWLKNAIESYKNQLLQYSDDLGNITIQDAQETMKYYNKILDAYFKNPWAMATDTSKNIVVANLKRGLADAVDDSLDDVLNKSINNGSTASEQYRYWKQLYSKIKTIEDEVSKRALVEARKNTKWLSTDIIDALAWGNLVEWLLTQSPTGFVKWAVMKWINAYNKYLNSPDTQIRNLFNLVESANNPWVLANAWNAVREGLQSTAPAVAKVYPWILAGWITTSKNNWQ